MVEYIDQLIEQWDAAPHPPQPLKRCITCRVEKCEAEYYTYKRNGTQRLFGACKACTLAKQRARLQLPTGAANRKATVAKYAATHADQIREKNRRYQNTANRRAVERRKTDVNFRLAGALRRRIVSALHGKQKSAKTAELLGCSVEYFREWLQFQFAGTMAWDNYGSLWEVDHVRPCCTFDLEDPAQQRECFSWKNQRPMLISPNRSKNGRPDSEAQASHQITLTKWLETHEAPLRYV